MSKVHLVKKDRIAEIVFDDSEGKHNILSSSTMTELESILEQLEHENELEMLLIRSAKRDSFIAGADINEIAELKDPQEAEEKAGRGQKLFQRISALPVPSAAIITGTALGGGLEMALWCDYRFAVDSESTKMGLPEVNLGIIPGFGGTQMLPRITGLKTALELILSGKTIDARRAEKKGLVDRRFPEGFARELAIEYVRKQGGRTKKHSRGFTESTKIGRWLIFTTARKSMRKTTGGHYPAPEKALEVLRRTAGMTLEKGLAVERAVLAPLAVGEISRNLISIFFQREHLKNKKHPAESSLKSEVTRGGVVGSGTMGGGIAWLFTRKDIPVRMKDIEWDAVAKGYQRIHEIYDILEKKRKVEPREASQKENLVTGTLDYSGFEKIPFVIEAIIEKLDLKHKVYHELEQVIAPDAVIASNTSSLSIADLSKKMQYPERMIGMHFFNPPNRMPLVEIVAGSHSNAASVAAGVRLARRLGKMPVVVGDCPGFLVNRLLMPYLNEAAYLAGEGVRIERIDSVMTGFGWPMGPFALLDMIGIDVGFKVAEVLASHYGERMQVAPLFEQVGSDKNLLGKKSGRGFYLYDGKKPSLSPEINSALRKVRDENLSKGDAFSDTEIQHRLMLPMAFEAHRALQEGIAESAGDVDIALVLGTGFPPFKGGLLKWVEAVGTDRLREFAGKLQSAGSVSGSAAARFAAPDSF